MSKSVIELYGELLELRHAAPAVEVVDALEFATDIVAELRMDEDDDLPIGKYDPNVFMFPDQPQRMIEDEESDQDSGDRSLLDLYRELMELRYSPDQPRRPNGEFGTGDGESKPAEVKPKESEQKPSSLTPAEVEKNLKDLIIPAWVDGGKDFHTLKNTLAQKIKNGNAEQSSICMGIRDNKVDAKGGVYRGLADVAADNLKVGDPMDIIPASFSQRQAVAEDFILKGKTGTGVVLWVQPTRGKVQGIKVNDYVKAGEGYKSEREVITGGKYVVTQKFTDAEHGVTYVSLKQKAVF